MIKKFKEVENTNRYWKPTVKGDLLQGEVLKIEENVINGEKCGNQYTIKDERQGEIKTPSHKMLQALMEKVRKSDVVRIEFTGTELPKVAGRKPTSLYKVFIEE